MCSITPLPNRANLFCGLFAINPNGTEKWQVNPTGPSQFNGTTSPAIGADRTIYCLFADQNVYAVNPDGSLKWKFVTGIGSGGQDAGLSVGADGTVFGTINNTLYAVDSNVITICGTEPNTYACPTLKWTFGTGSLGGSPPTPPSIGADGTIYVGSYANAVIGPFLLYAVNPDGSEKWAFPTLAPVGYSSPAIGADGTIYVTSLDDNVYAINPNGTERWVFTTDAALVSSPSIGADGTVYVSSIHGLYALGASSATPTSTAFNRHCNPNFDTTSRTATGTPTERVLQLLLGLQLPPQRPLLRQRSQPQRLPPLPSHQRQPRSTLRLPLYADRDLYCDWHADSYRDAAWSATRSPSRISFKSQKFGTPSKRKVVKLTNPKSNKGAVVIGSMTFGTREFMVIGKPCPSIRVGGKCTIGVVFKPSANGPQPDTLTISDNASNGPQHVKLSGIGKGAPLATPTATATGTATATRTLRRPRLARRRQRRPRLQPGRRRRPRPAPRPQQLRRP